MEFVFSVGNLNGPTGNIPRNELDIMERGTKQCEKLLEWMTPKITKKDPNSRRQGSASLDPKQKPENATIRAE